MSKTLFPALRMLLVLTILTGVIYPLVITLAAQTLFPEQANGSLIRAGETIIGSSLIGQNMNNDPRYFWSRPSAVSYNPLPSGGSNLGSINAGLQATVAQRQADFHSLNGLADDGMVSSEMLFASGSGLDPHISPEAARSQTGRIAEIRGIEQGVLIDLVNSLVEPPQLGFLGQERVNVLLLNRALDQLQ